MTELKRKCGDCLHFYEIVKNLTYWCGAANEGKGGSFTHDDKHPVHPSERQQPCFAPKPKTDAYWFAAWKDKK